MIRAGQHLSRLDERENILAIRRDPGVNHWATARTHASDDLNLQMQECLKAPNWDSHFSRWQESTSKLKGKEGQGHVWKKSWLVNTPGDTVCLAAPVVRVLQHAVWELGRRGDSVSLLAPVIRWPCFKYGATNNRHFGDDEHVFCSWRKQLCIPSPVTCQLCNFEQIASLGLSSLVSIEMGLRHLSHDPLGTYPATINAITST